MGEYTYDMVMNGAADESGFGGINPIDPGWGAPSHWRSYLSVPQGVDAAVKKIAELDGTVVEQPADIPGVGRMAVAHDPQGAYFALFESVPPQDPSPPTLPTPKGGVTWHELTTSDVDGAVSFYTGITGLSTVVMDVGTGPYTMLAASQEDPRAGIFQAPDGVPTAWTIYYEISQDSMDETLSELKRLGGQVMMGPMDVPTVGTIAVASDPTGGAFGLMKSAPPPA
jgi:predicted enzyme related to lactoylglutathione lyase